MWFKNTKQPIIALAPMADYTNRAFCQLCRFVSGSDFVIFREMVSSEAVVRKNEKTLKMCEFKELERPLVIQLFGSDPVVMAEAAWMVNNIYQPDGIDINMGCPVPKITGKVNAGAALMKDHDLAVKIIKAIKKKNPHICLSVKTRLGWSKKEEIIEFVPKLVAAGIDLLTIHGRTKQQAYTGEADWQIINKVKEKNNIPLLANGDIMNKDDLNRCLKITGADGVMIGRAALGNPWLLSVQDVSKISFKEKIEIILKHAELQTKFSVNNSLISFRKHLAFYLRQSRLGSNFDNKFRKEKKAELMKIKTLPELKIILDEFLKKIA